MEFMLCNNIDSFFHWTGIQLREESNSFPLKNFIKGKKWNTSGSDRGLHCMSCAICSSRLPFAPPRPSVAATAASIRYGINPRFLNSPMRSIPRTASFCWLLFLALADEVPGRYWSVESSGEEIDVGEIRNYLKALTNFSIYNQLEFVTFFRNSYEHGWRGNIWGWFPSTISGFCFF